MKRRGFSLIEMVIGMAIMGIAFYLLISIFITITARTATVETINTKVYLAQEVMEEYLTRNFSQLVDVAATNFPGSYSNYRYKIGVTYVATGELNTAVGGSTPFKNVRVSVWGLTPSVFGTVEIVSLMATYEVR
jgi:prepilin-type N-terminal cleavage/methylation domain-containing protein